MGVQVFVSTQGLARDLSAANGDYDSVDRGTMSQFELFGLLDRAVKLPEPDYAHGDKCPPGVFVGLAKDKNDLACFALSGGQVKDADTDETFTVEQAVERVVAKASGAPLPPAPPPARVVRKAAPPPPLGAAAVKPPAAVKPQSAAPSAPPVAPAVAAAPGAPGGRQPAPAGLDPNDPAFDFERFEVLKPFTPVTLSQFRMAYPYLAQGPESRVYAVGKQPPPATYALVDAGYLRRGMAFCLDLVPCLAILVGLVVVAHAVLEGRVSKDYLGLFFFVSMFVVPCVYFSFFESMVGGTPAKLLLGMRVVDPYGRPISAGSALLRNVGRFLEVLFFALSIAAAGRGARVKLAVPSCRHAGDSWADAYVVLA